MRDLEQIPYGYQRMIVISYLTHEMEAREGREGRKSEGEDDGEMEGRGELGRKAMMDQKYIEK